MSVFALDDAFSGEVDTRVWTGVSNYGARRAMSPVQRAKWNVAVLEELAVSGEIVLSAFCAVDAAVDFEFISVSPAAAGLLAQPDSLLGASLRDMLCTDRRFGQLYAVCLQVAARDTDELPVFTRCSWHRGASILFRIARTPTGLRVTMSCPEAQKSESEAIDALRALLEPGSRRYGECLGARDFQVPALLMPPAWFAVPAVGGPECSAQERT